MVAEAVDINTDPGFGRATDPDMTLGSSLGLKDTMTPGGRTGHSDCQGPGIGLSLGPQHDQEWQPRTGTSM